MFDAITIARIAQLQNTEQNDNILSNCDKASFFKRTYIDKISKILSLPSVNTRSLFIFSEENLIRKYAKMIIEWGYPFIEIVIIYNILRTIYILNNFHSI